MKTCIAVFILLIFAIVTDAQVAQQTVTVTSWVYGNRFCASASGAGALLSEVMLDKDPVVPGPVDLCVEKCTPEGERWFEIIAGGKAISYRAKDTDLLKDTCGQKVIVTGKASPTEKENVFVLEIASVRLYVEPVKKVLPLSNSLSPKFAAAAELWFQALIKFHDGKGKSDSNKTSKKIAADLIANTADEALWKLLSSYGFNLNRLTMIGLEPDVAKRAALDEHWKPILNKCKEESYRNILLNTGPQGDTECGRAASLKKQ